MGEVISSRFKFKYGKLLARARVYWRGTWSFKVLTKDDYLLVVTLAQGWMIGRGAFGACCGA